MNGISPALNENIFHELYTDEVLSFSDKYNSSNILNDYKVLGNGAQGSFKENKNLQNKDKILCFAPSLTHLTISDNKFLSLFKNQILNISSLKDICPRYAHNVLQDILLAANNNALLAFAFNEVGYDLAKALSLIYETPIIHHIEKSPEELLYRIVIKCKGKNECSFFATFEYEESSSTLALASEENKCSNLDCKCKFQFDNIDFLEYTLLNRKMKFLEKVSIFSNCLLFNTVMVAQSLIPVFLNYLKDSSSLIVASNNILQKLQILNSTIVYPTPIIKPINHNSYDMLTLDSEPSIDWKQWIDYFFVDCQRNGNDFEIITNDKGEIIGILLFFTNNLIVCKKYQNYNIHLKEINSRCIDNLSILMVMGELSNNKVHALSLLLSKWNSDEAYSLLLKSTLVKLKEPHLQVTEEIISDYAKKNKTPSRTSFFCENSRKQIEMFDKTGLTLKSKNDLLLLTLVKLFNNLELNSHEKEALKMFEFNKDSLDYVDDHINYGVIIYYKESSNNFLKFVSSTKVNDTMDYTFLFLKDFKLLYDNKSLIKTIIETKYGENAAYNITESDIKKADKLFKTSRDINEFILSLCILMYACQFHKKKHLISKVLGETSFGKDASKLSWMYNGLLAQQNVNLNGDLNCKFFKIIRIGKQYIKLNIRDDFGTGSNSSCTKLVSRISLKQKHSQNKVMSLIKRVDSINSNRLEEHEPQKFNKRFHDEKSNSRYLNTDYNELLVSNLNINTVGGLMISYLYYHVRRDVQFYSDIFMLLKNELFKHLKFGQTTEFEPYQFFAILKAVNSNLSDKVGLINKLNQFISNKLKSYREAISNHEFIAIKITCETFLEFLQSFECGECFRYNETKNFDDIHPVTFNYKLLNRSYSKYNCYTTHFECVHKFTKRIVIEFADECFKIKIIAPYKQNDIPIQYQYHNIEVETTHNKKINEVIRKKLKRFEQIPILNPLLENKEANNSQNCDSSSASLIETSQMDKYETPPIIANKKSLLIESDDTIANEVFTDKELNTTCIANDINSVAPFNASVIEKSHLNEEEIAQIPINNTHEYIKNTPIVKEEESENFDFIREMGFEPITTNNSSYNLNSFKNRMKRKLRDIHCGRSSPSSGPQSRHLRKRKNVETIQPSRRVLRKTTEGTEVISENIKSKKTSAVEDFFLGMDIYQA